MNKLRHWLVVLVIFLAACANTSNPVPTTTSAATTAPPPGPTPAITTTPAAYPQPESSPTPSAYPAAEVTMAASDVTAVPRYTYQIIHSYPHDPNAFTQGLVVEDGIFYEGTGLYGQSSLRRVDVASGEVQQMISLDAQYFGEGITTWGDRIIQLTWQENTGFVYDKASCITHDDQKLIMSDGTATLYFWDPETLAEIGHVDAFDENGPVVRLNELEYVEGEVWANVWQTNLIARIDPTTGQVVGWIDLTGLLDTAVVTQPVDVLNGIAYDTATGRLFVTGKLWPQVYEIEVIPEG
ncbi:MAG: glutaminyl-peptide cyclotransferase [Anaerolineae bacterium]